MSTLLFAGGNVVMTNTIRKPCAAGTFYPAGREELQKAVSSILKSAATPSPGGKVLAVMAPHAGYVFSAKVAAPAYLALGQADFETAVIIGHDFGRQARDIIAVTDDHDFFDTPLGQLQVDRELQEKLIKALPSVLVHNGVHARDHSVEVHLPFIKTLKPNAKILPVLFGEATPANCMKFAEALEKASEGRKILILASTDLCHYPSYNDAKDLDKETTGFIEKMDLPGLCACQAGKGVNAANVDTPICSAGGVGVAIAWCSKRGVKQAKILARANSGDVRGGDLLRVVGYASALFATAPEEEFALSKKARDELLGLARKRISGRLSGEKWQYTPPADIPELQVKAPAFVTLTIGGKLRGCIGYTVAQGELWRAVEEMAISAAFSDPRFPPVTRGELDSIRIEISVLSPMVPSAPEDIIPGKHGVMVKCGARRGLFLPQVWEQLPDKNQFMAYLCMEKAGLPADAWKDKSTTILTFTVFAFEE